MLAFILSFYLGISGGTVWQPDHTYTATAAIYSTQIQTTTLTLKLVSPDKIYTITNPSWAVSVRYNHPAIHNWRVYVPANIKYGLYKLNLVDSTGAIAASITPSLCCYDWPAPKRKVYLPIIRR